MIEASGLEARVIQHEVDHLDGVLILDRTTRDQRKEAMRALREAAEARRAERRAERRLTLVRTVYLGTSDFAAAVLERLAASRAPARARRHAARTARGAAAASSPRRRSPRPRASSAIDVLQPDDVNDAEALARGSPPPRPTRSCVCAFGALIKEPLLSAHAMLNVHPSLLPRWRGAAPVERAIMAGDDETGVSIMRVTAGLDSGPVCLARAREPIRPDDTYGTLAPRLEALGGELLVARARRAARLRGAGRGAGVTYAEKIAPADRTLDPAGPPPSSSAWCARSRRTSARASSCRTASSCGVHDAARVAGRPEPGELRRARRPLLVGCAAGALELLVVQPPGGRPMAGRRLPARPRPCGVESV